MNLPQSERQYSVHRVCRNNHVENVASNMSLEIASRLRELLVANHPDKDYIVESAQVPETPRESMRG